MTAIRKLKDQAAPLSTTQLQEHLEAIMAAWYRELTGITWKVSYDAGVLWLRFLTRNHTITEEESQFICNRMNALNSLLKPHNHCVERDLKGRHVRPDEKWKVQPKKEPRHKPAK